jgi:hypothetical protein
VELDGKLEANEIEVVDDSEDGNVQQTFRNLPVKKGRGAKRKKGVADHRKASASSATAAAAPAPRARTQGPTFELR